MKHILFWVSILFVNVSLWAQTDIENPKTYTISGLEVAGNEFTESSTIISLSGLAVGDAITLPSSQTSNTIRRLWKQGLFSEINLEADKIVGNQAFLIIRVKERPRISRFSFEGVSKGNADDLREKINFIRGTILTESKVQAAKRVIRNFYVEKGYYDLKVDIKEEQDPVLKNGVLVNIVIDKGHKMKINEIIPEGNTTFSASKIKRKMKKVKEREWWRVWARSKFVPKYFEEAKSAIIAAYNDAGHRDAKIVFDTTYAHDKKSIDVKMRIYEGKKYYFRNINWVGNYKYNTEQLKTVLGIKRGDVYSPSKLQAKLNGNPDGGDVSSLYMDDGYLFFNVDPVEVSIEGDSIDLEMRIMEGPQATIRKVIIEGNTKTSDAVILRELYTVPGEKFRRSDVIRSQRQVLALGYFDQEKMNVIPIPDINTGTVDLKYIVEEKPSDQFQVQGGWGGRPRSATNQALAGGFTGTIQLAFNNFSTKRFLDRKAWSPVPSGDGQKLTLSIQSGAGFQNFAASFQEPWLGGRKPNSLGVSASYAVLGNTGLTSLSNVNYRFNNFTTGLDYGRRLKFPDDYFQSYTSLSYRYFDITNPSVVFSQGYFGNTTRAFVNVISLKQTFSRSSIDAPIYPRSGSIMNFSVEATPPYSLFRPNANYDEMTAAQKLNLLEFHKWRFSSNWFFRIVGNMVLSTKIDAGFLGNYNSKLGTIPLQRYYLGGSGLQGFNGMGLDGREIIALRGYRDNTISNNGNGNIIFNKFTIELKQAITLNQQAPIWVLAFAEAGNGYDNFKKYNPFRLNRSAGAGIRLMLPMVGLVGLDWGYGFDNYDLTTTGYQRANGSNFHFIIGQAF